MSLGQTIPEVQEAGSKSPDAFTSAELADMTPTKRVGVMYERQITDLKNLRDYFQTEYEKLKIELREDISYRQRWSNVKRGKVEAVGQLITSSIFTGLGGLGMGIWPRTDKETSALFIVSACLVAFGVFIGLILRPLILLVCYKWPGFCGEIPKSQAKE